MMKMWQMVLAAMYSVLRQLRDERHFLDNCYPQVVRDGGNREARSQLERVMDVVDANWRGIGIIPKSGFALREEFAAHDARQHGGSDEGPLYSYRLS